MRDGVRESRQIDYKREWKMATDGDRREFLYDVASFANSGGGDLLYGISEEDGVPQAVVGLEGFGRDREQTAAEESLARGWPASRLPPSRRPRARSSLSALREAGPPRIR